MPHIERKISADEAFALMLETACEVFEILQALIDRQIQVLPRQSDELTPVTRHDFRQHYMRAGPRIQMALAKSFVFNARRANRICTLNKRILPLDRLERTRFLKATQPLIAVRDVNEHGFDGNGSVKPSMHKQKGGTLDETALVVDGRQKILMGPLNLYNEYLAIDRTRKLAGFSALYEKKKSISRIITLMRRRRLGRQR
jgi:hypothetical protein